MKTDLQKTEKILRTVLLIALIAYVIFVLWYTVFSRTTNLESKCYEGELFWSIRAAAADPQGAMGKEILYNCLMLIPLGFALAWVLSPEVFTDAEPPSSDSKHSPSELRIFLITTVTGFLLTCTIELLQLTLHKGLFEYDDIIYNTFGTVLGYLLYRLTRLAVESIFLRNQK